MNKKLLVTLLHKNIEELGMITAGFQEMNDYPQAIIQLALRKTEDIQTLITELAGAEKAQVNTPEFTPEPMPLPEPLPVKEPETPQEVAQEIVEEVVISEEETISVSDSEPEIVVVETSYFDQFPVVENVKESVPSPEPLSSEIDNVPDLIFVEEEVVMPEVQIEPIVEQRTVTETVVTEVKIHTEEHKKVTIAEKMAQTNTSRNDAMSHRDNSFSATIANKKISDIKQAISIGDRFRFQRELFKSNGEDMNKTLTYLNLLATLDEAMSFLQSKYAWSDDSEAANDFYQLVKRKFL